MPNGSGGFMSDITIDGGAFGMWVSNQQFTIRRVTITNAVSAIYQLWNWGFTWQDIQIVGCQVGFNINTGRLTLATQSAGSLLIVDSIIEGTGIGVRLSSTQPKSLAGSVILNNVQMQATRTANIQDGAGNVYSGTSHIYNRGVALLDPNMKMFYQKSRPQYNTYLPSQFLSVVSVGGAKGDGVTDDSTAINNFIAAVARRMWNSLCADYAFLLIIPTFALQTSTPVPTSSRKRSLSPRGPSSSERCSPSSWVAGQPSKIKGRRRQCFEYVGRAIF
ncbi:hypothetical protein B0H14DRAFT_2869086 [Mycena olivaceomarginata]|nr:hypothetical protein B0H14DRAFT_2869086 [Mycena olivaceomarginata]